MPDGRTLPSSRGTIVLFRSGLDAADDLEAIDRLRRPRIANAKRRLFANAAIDPVDNVKVVRMDKWYDRTLIEMRNLAVISREGVAGPVHRDARDLFCLGYLLSNTSANAFVLVRAGDQIETGIRTVLGGDPREPYSFVGARGSEDVVFDARVGTLNTLISAALDLYVEGVPYGIEDYDMAKVLGIAAEAVRLTEATAEPR
ncbi:MAG: hypothetical protein AAF913_00185 [Pseudomonadota bacterium]